MVIVLCLNLYTTRAVLQVLGVIDYGVYNVVCGFVSMFAFLNTSMSNGVQRFFNYELSRNGEAGATKVYNMALLIHAILAIIIVIATESFGLWYLHNKMVILEDRMIAAEWIFQFSILSFLFIVMQAPFAAAIMAHERMNFYAFVSIIDAVLKLAITFLIPYLSGDSLIWYGFLLGAISVLNFFMYFIYCKKNFTEVHLERTFSKDLFKSMLGFSGWNLFGSFAGVMKEQGINLVLNLFFGPVVNAARGVASQVNGGMQSFVQNLSIPIRPQVVQSYAREDYLRCLNLTFSLSKLSCCLIYLVALPLIMEIDFILQLWLGNNIPEHTKAFIVIVLFVTIVNNLNSPISGIIHASGQMKKYQILTSIVSLMCIPGAYLSLKLGCSAEVALSMVFIFTSISQYVALKVMKDVINYSMTDYCKKILLPFFILIISTFAFPLLPRLLMEESALRFLVVGTVSMLVTSAGIYFLVLNHSEKQLIKQMATMLKNKI